MRKNLTALNTYLAKLNDYFAMPRVTNICINQPGEIWVEQAGKFSRYENEALDTDYLWQFAQLVAEANQREITPELPMLSAVLPNGLRAQFAVEPVCESGKFVCAIRQKVVSHVDISDYFKDRVANDRAINEGNPDKALLALYRAGHLEQFLKQAILAKKNIVIVGGTDTGKTTVLNSLGQYMQPSERIITIETDREVSLLHRNKVHLLAHEENQGVSNVSMLGLLKTTLRLRPDRILLSEIRDYAECYPFLRAINSGHPGSMTTLHADSTQSCFDQLAFMMLQGGSTLSHETLIHYVRSIIHVIVQVKKCSVTGKRYIADVYFDLAEKAVQERIKAPSIRSAC